jgi:hypothetical protein
VQGKYEYFNVSHGILDSTRCLSVFCRIAINYAVSTSGHVVLSAKQPHVSKRLSHTIAAMTTTGTELCVLCEVRSEAEKIVFIAVITYCCCEEQVAVEETIDNRECVTV